jgi:hypothetical protein
MAKKNVGIITGFAVVMLMTLFVSCSTFPTIQASGNGVSYTVLGYVGASFETYDKAFVTAKGLYPEADGVVQVKGRASNALIPMDIIMGYYAVKFKESETAPRKKFLGIF